MEGTKRKTALDSQIEHVYQHAKRTRRSSLSLFQEILHIEAFKDSEMWGKTSNCKIVSESSGYNDEEAAQWLLGSVEKGGENKLKCNPFIRYLFKPYF